MIALGGPKLKPNLLVVRRYGRTVSMIALGGPKLKPPPDARLGDSYRRFNDSTGWA